MSPTTLAWLQLILAGLLEVGWAVGLKYTEGFSRLGPSLGTGAGMVASFYLLSQALRMIPVGSAYAIWTGIGAVGTAIFGMVMLSESRDAGRIVGLALIVAGIITLKITSAPAT